MNINSTDINELQNFPSLFIFDQLRVIDKIISAAGSECNPNETVLLILSKSLRRASQGGRTEISKRLPDWIKKQSLILPYLPEIDRKLIHLDSLVVKLKFDKDIFSQEIDLNQVSELISNSSRSEYPILIKKIPRWILECDLVFHCLKLEDKIEILCDRLADTEKTNSESIVQQILKSLSELSESEIQQLIISLPRWIIEREEVIPYLLPEEKVKILTAKLSSQSTQEHDSLVVQIAEELSKISTAEYQELLDDLPAWTKERSEIFYFLPLDKKLDILLNQIPIEDQKDFRIADFKKFLILEDASNLENELYDKNRLRKWLISRHKQWLQKKISIQQFIDLKEKYFAKSYRDESPLSPLYPILLKIDSDELLEESEIEFLERNRLFDTQEIYHRKRCEFIQVKVDSGKSLEKLEIELLEEKHLFDTLAIYYQKRYERMHEPWDLVKASKYWRDGDQPDKSLQVTEDLLNNHNPLYGKIRAAVFTTRGGAFRDLHRLEDAEHCANSAIQVNPKNYYPFNLLGAIYFERGNAEQGEVYFLKALELGAPQRSQEEQMKGALKNAGQAERQAVAQYLLKRDPVKYKWAYHYL